MRQASHSVAQRIGAFWATLALAACASQAPEPPLPQTAVVSPPPEISIDPETGRHSIEIEILIYNVAALPWPILKNRDKALKLIGGELKAMRDQGTEPDIVLLQETFRDTTKHLVEISGYPNWVRGPETGDRMPDYSDRASEEFRKKRTFFRGERVGKVMNSGLTAMSNWPITDKLTQPFYRHECAGFDCGANKGMLFFDVQIPGLPVPVHIMTTHVNAAGPATGVSDERDLAAHNLQVDHMAELVDNEWSGEHPLIFGGDFNMKQARERLDYFVSKTGERFNEVTSWCSQRGSSCDVRMSFDSDEPWLDTQDLQGWLTGRSLDVEPVMVMAMFDEPHPDAPKIRGRTTLSDHDGFLVRYRLSWMP